MAIADGKILAVGTAPTDFTPTQTIDASGCWVLPGLVDLAVRLREPGHEHAGMLHSEMQAAVAGGVTSLVCPPDTDPVLDEQGLVEMLKFRAEKQHKARLFPMGALTQGLQGDTLTEMAELTESGCVAFGQADVPMANTQALARALAYATTFGFSVWLRPLDKDLGKGVAASGPSATRMGLAGVPVAAETIALHTIFELIRGTQTRVHLCRLSSAAGVALLRQAKAQGLNVTADVSIHSPAADRCRHWLFRQQRPPDSAAAPAGRPRRAGRRAGRWHHRRAGVRPAPRWKKMPRSNPLPRPSLGPARSSCCSRPPSFGASATVCPCCGHCKPLPVRPLMCWARPWMPSWGGWKWVARRMCASSIRKRSGPSSPVPCSARAKSTPFNGMQLPGQVRTTLVDGAVVFSR